MVGHARVAAWDSKLESGVDLAGGGREGRRCGSLCRLDFAHMHWQRGLAWDVIATGDSHRTRGNYLFILL